MGLEEFFYYSNVYLFQSTMSLSKNLGYSGFTHHYSQSLF